MRKSEYICDICGDKITTDDITSGKTLDKKIFGLYFTDDANRFVTKNVWECSHHICDRCIKAISRIAKEEHLGYKEQ